MDPNRVALRLCGGLCALQNLELYDEERTPAGNYTIHPDGALSLNTADIYSIEYAGSGSWNIFDHYNHLITNVTGFPGSGAPAVGSEVNNSYSPGSNIEMPYTYYGYGTRGTNNTLRIKGANGYVDWTTTLSSGGTADYDESNCPNSSYCANTPPYYLHMLQANYYMDDYGNTS